jgi:hypothetical protein
MCFYSLCQQQQ